MTSKLILAAAAAAAIAASAPASAELGGAPTYPLRSVAKADIFAQGAGASTATPGYSVNETTLSSGTVIREYIGQSGTVFGIVWRGPHIVPLDTLLGSYFATWQQGAAAPQPTAVAGHGHLLVRQSGLVVELGGHMGFYTGCAYLPQALPQGMSAADIQ